MIAPRVEKVVTVPCPLCGARIGRPCGKGTRGYRGDSVHGSRIAAYQAKEGRNG